MDSSAVSKDNSGSVFGGFLLSILFIDELIVCLPAQFISPSHTVFSLTLRTNSSSLSLSMSRTQVFPNMT